MVEASYKCRYYTYYFYFIERSFECQIYAYGSSEVFYRYTSRVLYRYSEYKCASRSIYTFSRFYGDAFLFIRIYSLDRLFFSQIWSFSTFMGHALSIYRSCVLGSRKRWRFSSDGAYDAYSKDGSLRFVGLLTGRFRYISGAYGYSGYYSILIVIRSQGVATFFRFLFSFGASQYKGVLGISSSGKSNRGTCYLGSLVGVFATSTRQGHICATGFFGRCAFAFRGERADFQSSVSRSGCHDSIYCGDGYVPTSYRVVALICVLLSLRAELDGAQYMDGTWDVFKVCFNS